MATILPPGSDPARPRTSNATDKEQRPGQTRQESAHAPMRHTEPSEAEVMAEAAAIYPDTSPGSPTEEEIAAEAYAIYLGRGGEHGRDLDDWLEAERLLRRSRSTDVR